MTVLNHIKTITEEKEPKHWKVQEIEETIPDSVYKEFKEKTIAFTFEVKPDIEGAIRYFISEIGSDPQNLITAMVPYIRQMLEQTNNNNMRIVRQCLFDFSSIVNEIPKDLYNKELYIPIMQKLLFDMIIFYLEAKANNPLFDDVDELNNYFLPGDQKESFSSLIKNYSGVPDSLNINILDYTSVEQINNFVRKGITPAPKLIEQICAEEKEKLPWEKLMQYWILTNEEFQLNYALTSKKLKSRDIDDLDELMNIAFRLFLPEYHGICNTSKTFERDVLICFQQIAKEKIKSLNDLYSFKESLYNRLYYYSLRKENQKWDGVISSMKDFLKDLEGKYKSEMAKLLENFTALDLNRLFEVVGTLDPDTKRTYENCPMFHNVNPDKVVKCIMRLTNQERSLFRNILARHYNYLDVSNYSQLKYYEGERENVTKIVALLKKNRLTGVDKYSVGSIVQKFEEFLNK